MTSTLHPFDRALTLTRSAADVNDYEGQTQPDYWNMVGPFGGTTAAIALQAVMLHPALLGEPVALTVNYAAPVAAGVFAIRAVPVRTNRSTQHWTLSMTQVNADGEALVVMTATALTAVRRSTWSANDTPMPPLSWPQDTPAEQLPNSAWTARYDLRPVSGGLPSVWDGVEAQGEHASQSLLWVRDVPPRPLDFCALAAMADVFYPRVWLRRPKLVPAGTVSITTYFHAGAAQLAQTGTDAVLARASAQVFFDGFFDQTAHLWNAQGLLLATSQQIVYFKE